MHRRILNKTQLSRLFWDCYYSLCCSRPTHSSKPKQGHILAPFPLSFLKWRMALAIMSLLQLSESIWASGQIEGSTPIWRTQIFLQATRITDWINFISQVSIHFSINTPVWEGEQIFQNVFFIDFSPEFTYSSIPNKAQFKVISFKNFLH